MRKEEANQKLRLLHLDMLCKAVDGCDQPRPPALLQQTQASKSVWGQGYIMSCSCAARLSVSHVHIYRFVPRLLSGESLGMRLL